MCPLVYLDVCDMLVACMSVDAAFPTPMDEPRKVMSCHFLGTLPVSMATGIVCTALSCYWPTPYCPNVDCL